MQTFSVSQQDKSQFDKEQDIKYSSCRFIVIHLNNDYDMSDGIEFIRGKYEHWERDYYIEKEDLKPGKYLAFIEFDWHENLRVDQRKFSVTCYGQGDTTIKDETAKYEKEEFLKEAFIAKLKVSRKGITRNDFADKGASNIKRYV